MCGITGIVGATDRRILERMGEVIAHRGPDGVGYFRDRGIVLGHRRLAIVDLSQAAQQPMAYADRYVIVYNGEIYNYLELKKELEREGYVFRTSTDTEVVLAAYDKWGTGCLSRFNGMWAFALYDRRTRRLLLTRDRFGVKPLYWYRSRNMFAFASEIKALLEHPDIPRRPNVERCLSYVSTGPREHRADTMFEGICRLPHGSYVAGTLDDFVSGRFEVRRFWELTANDSGEPLSKAACAAYAEQYFDLLASAVRLRLRADVPIGSTLSGGIDSSSVVWLVNRELARRGQTELQETFSSVYSARGTTHCDETSFIEELSTAVRVRSHRIEPRVEDVIDEHRRMMWHMDTPPESTLMSSWHTFRLVSRTPVKVLLEGQGADEQLAGYPRFLINYLAHSPSAWGNFRALGCMPDIAAFRAIGLVARMSNCLGVGQLPVRALLAFNKHVYDGSRLNEALVRDSMTQLQNLIHYADRTSMAFSVESRMPFLDYRMAEFLAALPAAYKVHDGWTKYIARIAFDGRLPAKITWRRDKMGWQIPEDVWFRTTLRGWMQRQIAESRFVRDLGVGATTLVRRIRLLNLSTWSALHLEREAVPGPVCELLPRRAAAVG